MAKARIWKRMFGIPAIAMLFGAMAVQAQSPQNPSTNTKGNQTASPATSGTGATTQGTTSTTTGSQGTAATTGATQTQGTAATSGQAAGAPLARADQRLLIEMAQANQAEIDAGRLAQGKTQNQEVKNFAQQMINDHTKALQEIQQLAQAKGVTLPAEADSKHKKMQQRMTALSGDAFDRRYMAQAGVADHKKTHALLQRVQSRAKDADLKALATRLQPTVDQHLNMGQQMNATISKGAGKTGTGTASGGSGTSGSQGSGNTNGNTKPSTGS